MCGYCGRPLVEVDGGFFECPRCAPLLRDLRGHPSPADPDGWHSLIDAWARFVHEAVRSWPDNERAGQGVLL